MSNQGHHYWLTLVDSYSRHGWSYALKSKDKAKEVIIAWIAEQERQHAQSLHIFHCDRGGEFLNTTLSSWFSGRGIRFYFSNADTPQQNGVAEARNKSVTRILRSLLLDSGAPHSFWGLGLSHANHLANLLPHRLLNGSTPLALWEGVKPSLTKLRIWGCAAHVLVSPSELRQAGGN